MNLIKIFFDKFKIYFYLAFALAVVYFYVQNARLENQLENTSSKLTEANNNNKLMHEAYEKTLAIEREISEQKAITQEQKEEVIKTTSKVKEAVIKRGEIKQDEKSNFTIVTF